MKLGTISLKKKKCTSCGCNKTVNEYKQKTNGELYATCNACRQKSRKSHQLTIDEHQAIKVTAEQYYELMDKYEKLIKSIKRLEGKGIDIEQMKLDGTDDDAEPGEYEDPDIDSEDDEIDTNVASGDDESGDESGDENEVNKDTVGIEINKPVITQNPNKGFIGEIPLNVAQQVSKQIPQYPANSPISSKFPNCTNI
jgi:hypothetical protein